MGLKRSDLDLNEIQIESINAAISARLERFYLENPEADPPESMSITFNFVFGLGRTLEVRVGDLDIPITLS